MSLEIWLLLYIYDTWGFYCAPFFIQSKLALKGSNALTFLSLCLAAYFRK